MSASFEQALSQEELSALSTEDLRQFDKPKLHAVTDAVSTLFPHPDRPDKKWEKCLRRSDRIAERCDVSAFRKNVRRLLSIAKLPPVLNGTLAPKMNPSRNCSGASVFPRYNGTLRGGLNHDGPLIPGTVIDAVCPPAERTSEALINQLIEALFGDLRAEEVTEMWDADDEARDLRHGA
ncbi:MAG: hypothetical protein Q7S29_02335 [Candidatus Peribacter sp.]|nr:hypothetical protein [Candidatus Peribacter sp.]